MKLGRNMSKAEKLARVNQVMLEVNSYFVYFLLKRSN